MTRKDYIVIATAVREAVDQSPSREARIGAELSAITLANYLGDHYPNFNAERFIDACGVELQ